MEPVAAHAVALRPLRRHRVGVGVRRQRLVERGVEHGDVRDVGEGAARDLDPQRVDRVVQRGEQAQRVHLGEHLVVDHGRVREARAAVDDPVGDRDEPGAGEPRPRRLEGADDRGQRGGVVGQRQLARGPMVDEAAAGPADALGDPRHDRGARAEVDEAVLER